MTPSDPTPIGRSARLMAELDEIRDAVAAYFGDLPMPEAGLRSGEAWTPLDDLRHLTLAVGATTRGFRVPAGEIDRRFGAPVGPGRNREELARVASAGLEAGGVASPAITPPALTRDEATAATRDRCVRDWIEACDSFRDAVALWPDPELDRHQVPHPFLGLFTLREWTHFHILHARHHLRVAAGRREGIDS